jgi:hypothetical protein
MLYMIFFIGGHLLAIVSLLAPGVGQGSPGFTALAGFQSLGASVLTIMGYFSLRKTMKAADLKLVFLGVSREQLEKLRG